MAAPKWTSRATVEQKGNLLVAGNGGWHTEGAGAPSGYVFRFVRNGQTANVDVPPFRESHEAARSRKGAWPFDPNANVYTLKPEDVGQRFSVEVYGLNFSDAFGSEPAWAEWGRFSAFNGESPNASFSTQIVAWDQTTPKPPDVPGALLELVAARIRNHESVAYRLGWGAAREVERRLDIAIAKLRGV